MPLAGKQIAAQERLLFGCNYYPYYHSQEEMVSDFRAMREAGFNQTRTAEALTSWDRIEPQEGVFDWSFVDRLMEEAKKNDLLVVLGTGSSCPPHWLVKKYPDVQAVNKDNHKQNLLGTYNWACIDHPGFKDCHKRYLSALLDRYCRHASLGFWQINNEPGYPFVQEAGSNGICCYCDHSRKAFQDFLKGKYGSIEALNENWQWLATNLWFNEWEDIEMPRVTPAAWGAVTPWMDWHQFRSRSWTERFTNEARQIREKDSSHPILLNSFVYSRWDFFGILLGVNLWELAKVVDIFGSDLYPGIGNRYKREREYVSSKLFLEKSMAKEKPFWVPELESGPIGGYVRGPDHTPLPHDIGRYMAECLGHGAKEISFHGWREWRPQPMHWGGLATLEGKPTSLVGEVKKLIRCIKTEENFLLGSNVVKQGVALLQTQDNAVVLHGYGADDLLKDAIRGFVDLLWSENYYVDFLDPEDVQEGTIPSQVKVIILPYQLVIGPSLAAGLADFTKKGGTLVGTAKCGMMDHRGWYNIKVPGAGLDDVFGVVERNVFPCKNDVVQYGDSTFPAYHQRSIIDIQNAALTKVIGTFATDGYPAVTKTTCGLGNAWYIATHPGMSWLHDGRFSSIRELFSEILLSGGVKRTVWLNGNKNSQDIMDLHVLGKGRERMYIVTNSTDSMLWGSMESTYEHESVIDVITGEKYEGKSRIDITLESGTYIILKAIIK